MHGRIVFINPATQTGMIFGADRNRYHFRLSDWEDDYGPARNIEVTFATELYQAVKVKRATGQELTIDIFPETPPPPASSTAPDGDLLAQTAKNVAGFRNRMNLENEDDEEPIRSPAALDFAEPDDEPLTSGDMFPELNEPEPILAKHTLKRGPASPLFQIPGDKPRKGSSIRYYAMGVAGTLIMVAIAYMAVHL